MKRKDKILIGMGIAQIGVGTALLVKGVRLLTHKRVFDGEKYKLLAAGLNIKINDKITRKYSLPKLKKWGIRYRYIKKGAIMRVYGNLADVKKHNKTKIHNIFHPKEIIEKG